MKEQIVESINLEKKFTVLKIKTVKKNVVKVPKGMKDYKPQEMVFRDKIFGLITKIFKRHGAVSIDTPVMELKDILIGKYGEDSKLIYDIADQGGELCSLRYDLTVPFARYIASHKVDNIKRFHLGKVYRRDNPSIEKGRMREFFQCDFDIAGVYSPMIPDAECVCILVEIFKSLNLGNFKIKLNHRMILDGILQHCGVLSENLQAICSSIDKLDKLSWREVKKEMIEQKDLNDSVADMIGQFVMLNGKGDGALSLLSKLEEENKENSLIIKGCEETRLLLQYSEWFGVLNHISFDLSLARGLDYYTGIIYEVVSEEEEFGSLAAGGRYDNLVGIFSKNNRKVPCVGMSIGIERVISLTEKKLANSNKIGRRINETEVYVVTSQNGFLKECMTITKELWNAGIKTEFSYKENTKILRQLQTCEEFGIPFCVIVGPDELKNNKVTFRNVLERKDELIDRSDMISTIKNRLSKYYSNNE